MFVQLFVSSLDLPRQNHWVVELRVGSLGDTQGKELDSSNRKWEGVDHSQGEKGSTQREEDT